MPKRITIAPHLSPEELQAGFRQAKTTTQAHHYQIIWLLAIGKTTAEVMAVTGYSRRVRASQSGLTQALENLHHIVIIHRRSFLFLSQTTSESRFLIDSIKCHSS